MAAGLVRELGPVIAVALRLEIAAVILLVVARPRLRGRSRADWLAAGLLAAALGVMNLCFYGALGRLPLGGVVTIEFLGPLGLAAAVSRRPLDFVAVIAALTGVVAVSGVLLVDLDRLDGVGLALAVAAGACWAGYILASRTVSRRWSRLDGLAVAMALAAIPVTPLAVLALPDSGIELGHVAVGGLVAVLSSVLPYSLELVALRWIDTRVFGILLSLDPAVAALAGFLVLREALAPVELAGMALVVGASVMVLVTQSAGRGAAAAATGGEKPEVLAELAELG